MSSFNSGTSQYEYGPYSFKTQGTYRSTSAFAGGSVLGVTFDGAAGYLGNTRGVNVTKSVFQTPHP